MNKNSTDRFAVGCGDLVVEQPFNLDTEFGRSQARLALGAAGYDAAMKEHELRKQLAVVGGHVLQRSRTERWGELITVGNTGKSFTTIEQATEYATKNPISEIY